MSSRAKRGIFSAVIKPRGQDAGRIRLRPIIMTTLALIAGMIPVAIGHGEGADSGPRWDAR